MITKIVPVQGKDHVKDYHQGSDVKNDHPDERDTPNCIDFPVPLAHCLNVCVI